MSQPTTDTAGVLDTAAATAASVAAEITATMKSAGELARATRRLADQRVRERPWQMAMVVAGVAFLVGYCARGRD